MQWFGPLFTNLLLRYRKNAHSFRVNRRCDNVLVVLVRVAFQVACSRIRSRISGDVRLQRPGGGVSDNCDRSALVACRVAAIRAKIPKRSAIGGAMIVVQKSLLTN